jgi:hypothetical protein
MLNDWHIQFPGCEPVAHRLRTVFPNRWVRFHSLPGSKRYPKDEGEYAEMLGRQNRVLDELVGPRAGVVLLTTEHSGSAEAPPARPESRTLDPHARPWRILAMHDLGGDFAKPSYWHVFASEWEWRPGVLDSVLRLVADDVVTNVMVLSPDGRWLFHPYDGGMDVILETPDARDRIRSSHADWLSPRWDGL